MAPELQCWSPTQPSLAGGLVWLPHPFNLKCHPPATSQLRPCLCSWLASSNLHVSRDSLAARCEVSGCSVWFGAVFCLTVTFNSRALSHCRGVLRAGSEQWVLLSLVLAVYQWPVSGLLCQRSWGRTITGCLLKLNISLLNISVLIIYFNLIISLLNTTEGDCFLDNYLII